MKSSCNILVILDVMDSKGHYTVFRDFYDNSHSLVTWLQYDQYGINGSIRKRVDNQTQNTDYYFNTSGNLKACGTDMQISVYGYNSANTRTYKVNLFNANQWVNGQPQPIQPMVQNAMFYPNSCLTATFKSQIQI